MPDLVPVRRALLSVSDKTDLVPFARELASHGVELVSTGGTARALAEAGLKVRGIEDLTGFPEMLGGRVKTLHPKVHGGLLGLRDDAEHVGAMKAHGIETIDLLCVNLYPFERTIENPDVAEHEAIEQIDIGGPSMLRSGSKNFSHVCVVPSPKYYDRVINAMREHSGSTPRKLRAELAAATFARTAEYDATIAAYLARATLSAAKGPFPDTVRLAFTKADDLRYGENPHQDAALYRDPASTGPTVVNADLLHGKPLSYNNILDAAAALELVKDLRKSFAGRHCAAIIKHTNPCGASVEGSAEGAVREAFAGDPLAAYGGILAMSSECTGAAARVIADEKHFLEVIVAPSYEGEALALLKARWQNVRVLACGDRAPSRARKLDYRSVPGGMLVQDRDTRLAATEQWQHVAGPKVSEEELGHAAAVWVMVKHLKSNAVAIGGKAGGGTRLFGGGAGQMDRVASCRIALEKAGATAKGAVAASDAFFPFPDGPQLLIDGGVKVIVHPGGSKRDQETIELCNSRGVTCLLTGVRHFRH
ncbi:MAG: bifunctional phosphoribosylaminoimidazolecarboxamide formyltransferase/IMP cyclohydrolase [Phycisphaerales bacterium]